MADPTRHAQRERPETGELYLLCGLALVQLSSQSPRDDEAQRSGTTDDRVEFALRSLRSQHSLSTIPPLSMARDATPEPIPRDRGGEAGGVQLGPIALGCMP